MAECTELENENGFIAYLKRDQPAIWGSLENAAEEGLIVIDEANDAVTATNRLLLTYPGLHEILSTITNRWAETHAEQNSVLKALLEENPS